MMQQTETYKLNLIETSDTFSPAPLNENAQKLESALTAARAEAAAGITAGDAAEAQARANAIAAEAQARINADAAEAQARINADTAEAQARAAADAALGQRVTALELHQFAGGTYVGSSETPANPQFIDLGFTPQVVLLNFYDSGKFLMLHRGTKDNYTKIVEGGFQAGNITNSYYNAKDKTYPFIAIG